MPFAVASRTAPAASAPSLAQRRAIICASQQRPIAPVQAVRSGAEKLAMGAAGLAAAVLLSTASPALADGEVRASMIKASEATSAGSIYFGNGCFWGRQKDFIETERQLGRGDNVSAVVGYAGGTQSGPGNKVCYYYSDPRTVYEKLGHAEVVQVNVSDSSSQQAEQEFRAFAKTYFKQFRRTPVGMIRLDPQDAGPGYRNVVGLPGGVNSPLFKVLQQENVNGMSLLAGSGNAFVDGKPTENDLVNTIWIVDSSARPFYRAERYHQLHNGIGKAFPASYVRDLKDTMAQKGLIDPTGCPELPF